MLSIGLVFVAALPWSDRVGHSHWLRVDWVPFVSRRFRAIDVTANVLLCMPLGATAALVFNRGVAAAAMISLPLSMFVEWTQVYSHLRFPSMTDVACNVAGAMVAAALVRRVERRSRTTQ